PFHDNLICPPFPKSGTGAEASWGERTLEDDRKGHPGRINTTVKYSFQGEAPMSVAATSPAVETGGMTREHRKVIIASSLGTVFEWYDFYLYGSLAAVIAVHFFSSLAPGPAFIMALLTFAAGFAVRPFGAIVFGRLGDLIGRKYTFLITIVIMGVSTFLVGVLPTY